MATIKDIAREAGVSQGTVSNVLNGKGNVSSDKILLVENAAAKLGYTVNQRAKTLRKGSSNTLSVLLPNLNDRCYIDFFLSFKRYAEANNHSVSMFLSDGIVQNEIEKLETIQAEMSAGVATFSCLPSASKDMYEELGFDKSKVVFVERRPFEDYQYIGFDYKLAGRTLAKRIASKKYKKVVVVTETLEYSNQAEFYEGFLDEQKRGSGVDVVHLQTDMIHCYNHYLQLLRDVGTLDVVFFSNRELADRFKNMASSLCDCVIPDVYSVSSVITMPANEGALYELNYRLMGKTAAETLINKKAEKKSQPIYLPNDGFSQWVTESSVKTPKQLKVLTLDSPTAHIMEDLAKLYSRATGVEVRIIINSYDSIFELLNDLGSMDMYDVIRLDHTWLTGFAHKIFYPLEEIDPNIGNAFDSFIPGLVPSFSTVNGTIYSLPESPSAQVLFYRKDLFDSTVIRRLYKEKYREELMPPTDYRSFNQIAQFFTKTENPDSPIQFGTTLTLGNNGVAATEFLTRYFSKTDRLFDPDGKLLLDSKEAISAMEELIEARRYSSDRHSYWWRNTARDFAEGNVAMTVLFSNYASEMLNSDSKIIGKIGFAPVPGNNALVGGGCIGVCKNSRYKEEALDFIKWVCSDKVSNAMTLLGSVSPCSKTYENYEIMDTYPWLPLSQKSIATSCTIRTPDQNDTTFNERHFLSILGTAVSNTYNSSMSTEEALKFAEQRYYSTIK